MNIGHFGENLTFFVRFSQKCETFMEISHFGQNLTTNVRFSPKCPIFTQYLYYLKVNHFSKFCKFLFWDFHGGLTSKMSSFLWKMLHDILPTWERMYRMNLPGVTSAVCTLCEINEEDNSEHALLTCSYIRVGAENPLLALQQEDPTMTLERIKFLDFRSEDLYPMTFLTASILEQLWISRVEKKRCTWPSVRAQVQIKSILCLMQHLPSKSIHNVNY